MSGHVCETVRAGLSKGMVCVCGGEKWQYPCTKRSGVTLAPTVS